MITRFVNKSVKSVILLAFVLGGFTMWGYGGPKKELKKPNIVFILSDNQPTSAVGCYGNPDIKTPHIDQLAKEGIKFTNVYAANGVCSPTRATLMTEKNMGTGKLFIGRRQFPGPIRQMHPPGMCGYLDTR